VDETRDNRNAGFIMKFPEKVCHSTYAPLDCLLADMAAQLRGDLDFAKEGFDLATRMVPADGTGDHEKDLSRSKDEYLHEAFQRLIFNFLFKYYDAEFMKEKKSKDYRKVENERRLGTLPPLSSHQSESTSSRQRKRKREQNETSDGPDNSGPKPVSCISRPLTSRFVDVLAILQRNERHRHPRRLFSFMFALIACISPYQSQSRMIGKVNILRPSPTQGLSTVSRAASVHHM
jgi:hypothetical protein